MVVHLYNSDEGSNLHGSSSGILKLVSQIHYIDEVSTSAATNDYKRDSTH